MARESRLKQCRRKSSGRNSKSFTVLQRVPLKSAYKKMLDKHFNVGTTTKSGVMTTILAAPSEQPTYGQFGYWYRKQRNLHHSIVKREGQRKSDLQSRALLGSSTQMACGPGTIFQIEVDVYLVSSLNRSWIIRRPIIYFVIDVFGRMAFEQLQTRM